MLNINNITVQYGNKNPSIVNLSMGYETRGNS